MTWPRDLLRLSCRRHCSALPKYQLRTPLVWVSKRDGLAEIIETEKSYVASGSLVPSMMPCLAQRWAWCSGSSTIIT